MIWNTVNDGIERPQVSSTQLRSAMRVIHDHMHREVTADRASLLRALEIMKEAARNENWVIYIP